ncbi:PD-(D/E)XK motif protein [Ramlibacter sp. PS3R-8]|uniref:PD-(D/E)XK motif protein n=1 Tax=Ramlibacter sp. PS3R-8 TaxID=3133437 RepID=UPI0030A70C1C
MELWARLRTRRPLSDDGLETEPAESHAALHGVMYGMDHRGDLHLLVPVDGPPPPQRPPDLRGLRVRHRILTGLGDYLDLFTAPCHASIFSALCVEILNGMHDQGRRPWELVFATIRAWHSAWKALQPGMDKSVQVGLYGELLALEHIMIPAIGTRAVYNWSGPLQERHDFVGEHIHVECKTTRKRRHEHEISRVDQLRVPVGRKLIVISVLLEESLAGPATVATRIDAISDALRRDPSASDDFQAKLVQLGWSDEMRRTGELIRFQSEFGSLILEVDQAFPRLPDDFTLPPGVVALRYTVDFANLPGLGQDEILEAVKQGFPQGAT